MMIYMFFMSSDQHLGRRIIYPESGFCIADCQRLTSENGGPVLDV